VQGWVLERLVGAERGVALVAIAPDGSVVGLANLVPVPAPALRSGAGAGTAEAALLVEDAWQGRRIGTTLFRRLAAFGRELGITEVSATVLPSNARMWRLLRRAGLAEEIGTDGRLLRMNGVVHTSGSHVPGGASDGPAVRATISAQVMAGSTV
jgi:RimJ/RimL family protein N-acetyltransferase